MDSETRNHLIDSLWYGKSMAHLRCEDSMYPWQKKVFDDLTSRPFRTASEIEDIAFNSGRRFGKTSLSNEFIKKYTDEFMKYLKEKVPMKIEEVRIDQQVEFFDSRYEGGPHLGVVTDIEGDMVNVKFTYKNIVVSNVFNPGQLKLVKQAHTLEEKLISRMNDMENRLTQRINNTPSALTIEKRLQDLRGLIVDSSSRSNDHIVNCFKVHDQQTDKSISTIVERINYVNTQMVKLSDELDAANKNAEHYKNEFIQSELKLKKVTEENNHLVVHHADVCKRFDIEIESNEDLRKLLCESESTLFYQKLWTIGLFMTTAVFAVGFFLK